MTSPFDNVSMVAVFRLVYGSRSSQYMRAAFAVKKGISEGKITEDDAATTLLSRMKPLDEEVMKEIYLDLLRKLQMHGVDLAPIRDQLLENGFML